MSNVPPATPPQATGAITSSPNTQDGLSQQQQNAGQRSAGGQTPKETAPPPASPAVTIAASLAGLREGMRFKGQMTGSDANGLPVLKTPNGTFVLSQAVEQLTLNGEADIEIRVAGNKITALIMAIAGKAQHPPKEVSLTMTSVSGDTLSGKTMSGGLASGLTPRGVHLPTINIGTQLTANVLSAPSGNIPGSLFETGGTLVLKVSNIALSLPGTSGQGGPAQSLTPGQSTASGQAPGPSNLANEIKTQLSTGPAQKELSPGGLSGNASRLASAVSSAPASATPTSPAATSSTAVPGTTPAGTPQAGATAAQTPTNSAVIASAATASTLQVTATPGSPASPAVSAAISQSALLSQQAADIAVTTSRPDVAVSGHRPVQGEVIGPYKDGGLLVRTSLGDISLTTRAVLPPGSRLTFETVATRAPDSVQRPVPQGQVAPVEGGVVPQETMRAVRAFAHEWPAMKETVAALQAANPAVAQNLVTATMPGANSSLASSILLFLSAVRGGDMRGWLGAEATTMLERGGREDLLNRLATDAAQMGRASEASGQGDWRAIPFPLYDGNDIQQLWAFVREHRRAGDQADKKALRFVVEMELTALGGMQLDGLIQDKQFDLIVRNSKQLPENVRQDLSGIFEGSVEATGFSGSLVFQSDSNWPVSPFRESQQEAGGHGEIVA